MHYVHLHVQYMLTDTVWYISTCTRAHARTHALTHIRHKQKIIQKVAPKFMPCHSSPCCPPAPLPPRPSLPPCRPLACLLSPHTPSLPPPPPPREPLLVRVSFISQRVEDLAEVPRPPPPRRHHHPALLSPLPAPAPRPLFPTPAPRRTRSLLQALLRLDARVVVDFDDVIDALRAGLRRLLFILFRPRRRFRPSVVTVVTGLPQPPRRHRLPRQRLRVFLFFLKVDAVARW